MSMLLRFDPFREIDRALEQTRNHFQRPSFPMDAYRHGDTFVAHFDLPGVDPGTSPSADPTDDPAADPTGETGTDGTSGLAEIKAAHPGLEVRFNFPTIASDTVLVFDKVDNGGGIGLDLGLAYSGGPWSAGVTAKRDRCPYLVMRSKPWSIVTKLPYVPLYDATVTVPSAAISRVVD